MYKQALACCAHLEDRGGTCQSIWSKIALLSIGVQKLLGPHDISLLDALHSRRRAYNQLYLDSCTAGSAS